MITLEQINDELNKERPPIEDPKNPFLLTDTNGLVFAKKSDLDRSPKLLNLARFGINKICTYLWRGAEHVVYTDNTKVYKIHLRTEDDDDLYKNRVNFYKNIFDDIRSKICAINSNGGAPIEHYVSRESYMQFTKVATYPIKLPISCSYYEPKDAFYIYYRLSDVSSKIFENGIIEQDYIDPNSVLGSGARRIMNSDKSQYGISTTNRSGNLTSFTGELGKTLEYCERLKEFAANVYNWDIDATILGNFMFDEPRKVIYVVDPVYSKIYNKL